jgi:thiosulfate dehydrogenase (quinone) large subunit
MPSGVFYDAAISSHAPNPRLAMLTGKAASRRGEIDPADLPGGRPAEARRDTRGGPEVSRPVMLAPQLWIVLLRLVVGGWFLKAVWTKLTLAYLWDVIPYPVVTPRFIDFHPKRVAEFAAGNPVGWYKEFLETTVLPNAPLFATLQAYGEVAVGLGLVLGLVTGLTALVGLFMSLNFGLATQWMSFGQQGFHALLITSMLIFLGARAGRAVGVDGWVLRHAAPRTRRRLRWLM